MDGAEILNVDMLVGSGANMGNLDMTNFHDDMNNCSTGSYGEFFWLRVICSIPATKVHPCRTIISTVQ